MLTKSGTIVNLMQATLLNATRAGINVFVGRTWPVRLGEIPVLIVDPLYDERRESQGRAAPEFRTFTTIRLRCRVSAKGQVDDAGGLECRDQLEYIKREIELALINATPIMKLIEGFSGIETAFRLSTEGEQNFGELVMAVSVSFVEGPEDFAPIDTAPLKEMKLYTDFRSPFSPTGTYAETPFSANPPPRTSGPDGRIEGGVDLTNLDA